MVYFYSGLAVAYFVYKEFFCVLKHWHVCSPVQMLMQMTEKFMIIRAEF